MARFDLENYISVDERIQQFYEKYPDGSITTELLNVDGWNGKQTQFIVKSSVWGPHTDEFFGRALLATGLAEETLGTGGANATAALENAETSAIGRALANLNFATTKDGARRRTSREEMDKVNRHEENLNALRDRLLDRFGNSPIEISEFLESMVGRSVKTADLSSQEVETVNAGLDLEALSHGGVE